jgi:peptidoglycan/LPS O-acetylase OafA/YrhL
MESKDPRARNSYDFVRFIAASAVLFSHHFYLSQLPEPAVPRYGEDFGKLAVEFFFSLSGFLICRSLRKNPDWAQFVSARVLRIFPNLAFSLVTASLATLIWYHNYVNTWKHVGYVIGNLLLFFRGVTFTIPGVFGGEAVNGPLWSLPCELWLYVLLFSIFFIGGRRSSLLIFITAVGLSVAWYLTPPKGGFVFGHILQVSRLGSFFMSGAILAVCWPYIEKHAVIIGGVALAAILLLGDLLPAASIVRALGVAAVVIGLGSSKSMAWFAKGGDASYGIYIFAWPLQEFSLLFIHSFWLSMLIAFTATTTLGYATWHLFEKRALSYRKTFAESIRTTAAFWRNNRELKVEPNSPPP